MGGWRSGVTGAGHAEGRKEVTPWGDLKGEDSQEEIDPERRGKNSGRPEGVRLQLATQGLKEGSSE